MERLSRLRYNGRWALALLLAGVFSIWTRQGWCRIGKAFGLWLGLVRHHEKRVSLRRLERRLETCRKCPIYFKPLQTCGSPVIKRLRRVGCWCYCPESAKLNEKKCFLDSDIEPGYPGGWQHAGADPAGKRRVPARDG